MTLETWVQIAELIAAVAVVISLVYLALQVRQSNRVNSASARHAISEFAMQVSMFHAQHADRLAKVHSEQPLTEGDQLFRWWAHMQFFLHAETYHRQYELGLMPAALGGIYEVLQGLLTDAGCERILAGRGLWFFPGVLVLDRWSCPGPG